VTEALRALAVLAEPPCVQHAAIAHALALPAVPPADEHTDALVFQVYPYASVYLGAEGMLGGDARDRIAGFWRALGAEPPAEPDHATVLLAALAELGGADQSVARPSGRATETPYNDARVHAARRALYWEHVASWMPPFLAALRRVGSPFYAAWAERVADVLAAEAAALGPPAALPACFRVAPPEPPASLDALLALVLAPVQAGALLVRDDLARCAAALGLGLRAGERRYALRALLEQDAARVLAWLAGELRVQAAAYPRDTIGSWWRARAHAAAELLDAP
jgi:nitrate reductase delta subunit